MANEKRLIDANALRVHRGINVGTNLGGLRAIVLEKDIRNAPTVEAVEVVHGRWEPWAIQPNGFVGSYRCTACGIANINDSNYCPNCGAKMDGERKDNG